MQKKIQRKQKRRGKERQPKRRWGVEGQCASLASIIAVPEGHRDKTATKTGNIDAEAGAMNSMTIQRHTTDTRTANPGLTSHLLQVLQTGQPYAVLILKKCTRINFPTAKSFRMARLRVNSSNGGGGESCARFQAEGGAGDGAGGNEGS